MALCDITKECPQSLALNDKQEASVNGVHSNVIGKYGAAHHTHLQLGGGGVGDELCNVLNLQPVQTRIYRRCEDTSDRMGKRTGVKLQNLK